MKKKHIFPNFLAYGCLMFLGGHFAKALDGVSWIAFVLSMFFWLVSTIIAFFDEDE